MATRKELVKFAKGLNEFLEDLDKEEIEITEDSQEVLEDCFKAIGSLKKSELNKLDDEVYDFYEENDETDEIEEDDDNNDNDEPKEFVLKTATLEEMKEWAEDKDGLDETKFKKEETARKKITKWVKAQEKAEKEAEETKEEAEAAEKAIEEAEEKKAAKKAKKEKAKKEAEEDKEDKSEKKEKVKKEDSTEKKINKKLSIDSYDVDGNIADIICDYMKEHGHIDIEIEDMISELKFRGVKTVESYVVVRMNKTLKIMAICISKKMFKK